MLSLPHRVHAEIEEGPIVPPPDEVSRASIVSSGWVELVLPENPYSSLVGDPTRYVIASDDDPDFAGSGIQPSLVQHRHWPEEARYGDRNDGIGPVSVVRVMYRVFLRSPIPMKEGKHYRVEIDPAVLTIDGPLRFDFNAANEAIHVNHVAYLDRGVKVAYLSAWTGEGSVDFGAASSFSLIDERTGQSVYRGAIHLDVAASNEPWSQSNVYSLDFTGFTTPGSYHLHIDGIGRSFSFTIDPRAFNRIGYTVIRGLTMQRDGDHGLDSTSVTHWNRPAAHLDDAIDEATGQRVDLVGGHMDAGDRGKYPHDTADTAAALISAIDLFPAETERLGDALDLPESGNGIPDLIDEALYELDYLAKTVDHTGKDGAQPWFLRPAGGGYEQGVPPEGETGRVFFDATKGPYRAETLYVAGALAMAFNSPMIKRYAPQRAAAYLSAALRAFAAFEKHNADGSYWQDDTHSYDLWTAGPHQWSDEMLLAAAGLYEATGEAKYLDWIVRELPADLDAVKLWTWKLDGPWLQAYHALHAVTRPGLETVKEQARAAILSWADTTRNRQYYPAPFGMPLPVFARDRVGWYFSTALVGYPVMLAYGVSRDDSYRQDLIRMWSYVLGGNPLSRTFITGLGQPDRRPRWIVHEIARYQWGVYRQNPAVGWAEPPPGILAADLQNGAYDWFMRDDWNSPRIDARYPALEQAPALYRYHDSWTVENEVTINSLARGAAAVVPLVGGSAAGGGEPDAGAVDAPADAGVGAGDARDGGGADAGVDAALGGGPADAAPHDAVADASRDGSPRDAALGDARGDAPLPDAAAGPAASSSSGGCSAAGRSRHPSPAVLVLLLVLLCRRRSGPRILPYTRQSR